ncbi:MAG: calcium-binding protein [Synechocystis sp.]
MSRPEDTATNPNDGTQAVVASTGRQGIFEDADVWGTTYIVDVDFTNIDSPTADLNILFDGNDFETNGFSHPDFGLRSPDNLDWADDGLIYLQEDRAISSSLFGATSGEEASIWTIDPNVANPETTLIRVAQIDRSAVPTTQSDPVPTDIGNWESSGILDISTLVGNAPGTVMLFDVQAHSLRNGTIISNPGVDTNGDGTITRQDNLVEGGQLSLLIAPGAELIQDSTQVFGTNGVDDLAAGVDFSGLNDIVFTGAGDDIVDVLTGGVLTGNNRINAGSGMDEIYVGNGDRANGGSGDDYFDASAATGYRLSGGKGDDIFDLGASGRALGGDGDDQFYVLEGGDNLLSGGAGADQFWLLTDVAPTEANIVTDFVKGTDVIGIANQGSGVNFNNLSFTGNSIALNGDVFAVLNGINTASLTAADFVFM